MLSLPVSTPNLSSFCVGQYERLCVLDRMEVGEAITLLLKHVGMDASLAPAEVLKKRPVKSWSGWIDWRTKRPSCGLRAIPA
jgi:hypothetical protein